MKNFSNWKLWCWKIYGISLATFFLTISERSHTFQLPDGTSVFSDRKLFDGMLYKEIGVLTTMIIITII